MVGRGKTLRGKQLLGFIKAGRAAGAEFGVFLSQRRKIFLLGVRNPTFHLLQLLEPRKEILSPRGKAGLKDALWFFIAYVGKS